MSRRPSPRRSCSRKELPRKPGGEPSYVRTLVVMGQRNQEAGRRGRVGIVAQANYDRRRVPSNDPSSEPSAAATAQCGSTEVYGRLKRLARGGGGAPARGDGAKREFEPGIRALAGAGAPVQHLNGHLRAAAQRERSAQADLAPERRAVPKLPPRNIRDRRSVGRLRP